MTLAERILEIAENSAAWPDCNHLVDIAADVWAIEEAATRATDALEQLEAELARLRAKEQARLSTYSQTPSGYGMQRAVAHDVHVPTTITEPYGPTVIAEPEAEKLP